jgi:2-keto-3-deoxy-L-rhamnonate aldolase RhmA
LFLKVNLDVICAVEGVDVVHVGANDLLTAMGKPGSFVSTQYIAALEKVIAA